MGAHQTLHGDGVKDVAFEVEDLNTIIAVCSLMINKCCSFVEYEKAWRYNCERYLGRVGRWRQSALCNGSHGALCICSENLH